MRGLAIYNFKGGVGKTTAAVPLAWLSAEAGLRTLLWDLDSQGAASYLLRVEPESRVGSRKLVAGERELGELLRESDQPGLFVVPADLSYRKLDLALAAHKRPASRLAKLVKPLVTSFDLLVLDCPPTLSLLAESVLALADRVLVPTLPTPLSLRALVQLAEHLERRGLEVAEVRAFLSMVDRRKGLHREPAWLARRSPFPVLDAGIPYASLLEESAVRREPVFTFAPKSSAARAYRALWREVFAGSGGR